MHTGIRIAILAVIALGLLLLAGCKTSQPVSIQAQRLPASPAPGGTAPQAQPGLSGGVQSSSGGAVTIDAKWRIASDTLVFDIAMDTHSVDLDPIDLKKAAVLRDDLGKQYSPVAWTAPAGGHHRSGKLVFPLPPTLAEGKPAALQLVISDVAGIKERVLAWNSVPR